MNRSIRATGVGLAAAVGALAISVSPAVADQGFTTPTTAPPPPSRTGAIVATPPQRSTTCEGNDPCAVLRFACELVGGTYSGWDSRDPGHDHTHGLCTWPWE